MIFGSMWADLSACLGFFSLIIGLIIREKYMYFKKRNIVNPKPIFIFGNIFNTFLLRESIVQTVTRVYKQFHGERLIGFFQGLKPTLIVCDPDLVNRVLIKDFSHFHDRGLAVDEETNPLDGNLFNLSGSKWKTLRNKLTPTFTSGKLKGMFSLMDHCVDSLLNKIEKNVGEEVEMKDLLSRLTIDVIGTCAFGIESKALDNPDSEFKKMGSKIFYPSPIFFLKNVIRLFFPSVAVKLKMKTVPQDVNNFFFSVVKQTFDHRLKTNEKKNDFIQLLLELREKGEVQKDMEEQKEDEIINVDWDKYKIEDNGKLVITDEILTAQSFIFFVAGFETSATGLTFICYLLSKHSDVQQKLRQHVREIKEKHGSISYTSLKEMDYLEACINESMRLYPPAGVLFRKCNRELDLGGQRIDAGTSILIPVKGLHRDKDLFRDPDIFLPERFLTDRIVPGSFLPFGDGPRLCIAQRFAMLEMKLTLAKLVDRFKIETCPTMASHEPLQLKPRSFVPTATNGIHCRLVKAS